MNVLLFCKGSRSSVKIRSNVLIMYGFGICFAHIQKYCSLIRASRAQAVIFIYELAPKLLPSIRLTVFQYVAIRVSLLDLVSCLFIRFVHAKWYNHVII